MPNPAALRALVSGADEAGDAVRRVIRAYHGSPHDFDRFDASKIGTGEGAQAYGHGLYFAGGEDTARHYRNNLAGQLLIDGQPVTGKEPSDYVHIAAAIASGKDVSADVAKAMAARDHWAAEVDRIRGIGHDQDGVMPGLGQAVYKRGLYQDYLDAYEMIKGRQVARNKGHMYEVDIDYPEEALLDLNAPVLSQSPAIQAALGKYAEAPSWFSLGQEGWHGKNAYTRMASELAAANPRIVDGYHVTHDQPAASAALLQAGVPGMRYLDGGSRSAGEGTRNYVMFPGTEDRIRILRKFGLLAPMGAGMMGEQSADTEQ